MKREFIAVVTLLLGLAQTGAAQDVASANVHATVQAVTFITVTGSTDFGIVPGHSHHPRIDSSNPAPGQSTAQFSVTVPTGFQLLVHLSAACPIMLTRTGGTETMVFYGAFTRTTGTQPQTAAPPDPECLGGVHHIIGDGTTFHFWLGGRLEVGAQQAPGSYAGMYQITAEVAVN
jgi:hypothetical protein